MAFITFSGDTTPSLADLDANFAKCLEYVPASGTATLAASPALTNTGNQVATMQAVRQLGRAVSTVVQQSGAVTLTTAAVGTLQSLAGSTAYTVTLPSASAFPAGTAIAFVGNTQNDLAVTLARAGTDTITADGINSLTSVAIYPGMVCDLISNGTNGWIYVGTRRRFIQTWVSGLPGTSTAVAASHPLGVRPRFCGVEFDVATANNGYNVGDRPTLYQANGASFFGTDTRPESIQIIMTTGSTGFFVSPAGGGNPVAVTGTQWRYRMWAEV
jgi:hypothetical protein